MEISRAEIKYLCHVHLFGFPFYQSKCVLCVNVFLSTTNEHFSRCFICGRINYIVLAFSQIDVIYIFRTVYVITLFCTHIQENCL